MKNMSLGLAVALGAGFLGEGDLPNFALPNFTPIPRSNSKRSGAARLKRKAKKLHNIRKRQSLSQR